MSTMLLLCSMHPNQSQQEGCKAKGKVQLTGPGSLPYLEGVSSTKGKAASKATAYFFFRTSDGTGEAGISPLAK